MASQDVFGPTIGLSATPYDGIMAPAYVALMAKERGIEVFSWRLHIILP
jgi:hypothetical protein